MAAKFTIESSGEVMGLSAKHQGMILPPFLTLFNFTRYLIKAYLFGILTSSPICLFIYRPSMPVNVKISQNK